MAGAEPHPPRPPQEDVEKLTIHSSLPNTQSIPHPKHSNLRTNMSNIDPIQSIAKLSYSEILQGGNQQSLAVSSKPSGLNNCQGMDIDSVALKARTWYQGKPAVTFSLSEKNTLVEKLKFVLIGKFSHGRPTMLKINDLFTALKLCRPCNIIAFDKKHIFIECACKTDYDRIWLKLNWIIDGFVMRIIKWTAEFNPIKESPIVPVWIRIEGLPLFLFEEVSLLSIANQIGKPIRVDPRNVAHTLVTSARICVELDVSQPLLHDLWISFEDDKTKVMLEGFWVKVFYDVLPSFCEFCSHIGHDVSSCKRWVEESSRHKGVVVLHTSHVEFVSAPRSGSGSQDHAARTAVGVSSARELTSGGPAKTAVAGCVVAARAAQTGGPASRGAQTGGPAQTGGSASRAAVAAGSAKKTVAGCVKAARDAVAAGGIGEPAKMAAAGVHVVQTYIDAQELLVDHTKILQNEHKHGPDIHIKPVSGAMTAAEQPTTRNSFTVLNEVVHIEDITLEEGEIDVEEFCAATVKSAVVVANNVAVKLGNVNLNEHAELLHNTCEHHVLQDDSNMDGSGKFTAESDGFGNSLGHTGTDPGLIISIHNTTDHGNKKLATPRENGMVLTVPKDDSKQKLEVECTAVQPTLQEQEAPENHSAVPFAAVTASPHSGGIMLEQVEDVKGMRQLDCMLVKSMFQGANSNTHTTSDSCDVLVEKEVDDSEQGQIFELAAAADSAVQVYTAAGTAQLGCHVFTPAGELLGDGTATADLDAGKLLNQTEVAVLVDDEAVLGTGSSNDGSTQGSAGQDMEKEEGEMVEGLGLLNDSQSWADLVEEEHEQQLPPTGAIKSESEGADGSESECKQTGTQQGHGTISEKRQQKMMDYSTIEGFAMEEIEMLMASPTRMDPVFTISVPNLNKEAILDLEGTPVLCYEVIRKSSRIADVRKHFQFLSNEKLVAAMVEEGKYEDFIMDAMKAYTKEIHRSFLEQEKSIYPKDSATETVTYMTQEAIPKVSTMDEKEWTTPKRRGRNRNRPK